jgi:hypothetical protein
VVIKKARSPNPFIMLQQAERPTPPNLHQLHLPAMSLITHRSAVGAGRGGACASHNQKEPAQQRRTARGKLVGPTAAPKRRSVARFVSSVRGSVRWQAPRACRAQPALVCSLPSLESGNLSPASTVYARNSAGALEPRRNRAAASVPACCANRWASRTFSFQMATGER